jgi:hypothetical protein
MMTNYSFNGFKMDDLVVFFNNMTVTETDMDMSEEEFEQAQADMFHDFCQGDKEVEDFVQKLIDMNVDPDTMAFNFITRFPYGK